MNDGGCTLWCGARGACGETRAIVHGVHLPVMLKRSGGITLTYSLPTLLHSSDFILPTSYGSHRGHRGRREIAFLFVSMNDGGCTLWCGSHRGHRGRREIAFLFVSMNDGGCTLWCGARGARGETWAIVHGVHLPVMLKRRGGIALTYSLPTLLHSSDFILSTSYGSRGDAETRRDPCLHMEPS
jgi:hypothetical protein